MILLTQKSCQQEVDGANVSWRHEVWVSLLKQHQSRLFCFDSLHEETALTSCLVQEFRVTLLLQHDSINKQNLCKGYFNNYRPVIGKKTKKQKRKNKKQNCCRRRFEWLPPKDNVAATAAASRVDLQNEHQVWQVLIIYKPKYVN